MIEIDVQLDKEKNLILMHDDTLDSTTNGSGPLANKTLNQIKQLRLHNGEQIPTLPEILDLINRKTKVNIDLKGKGTGAISAKLVNNYVKNKGWKYEDFFCYFMYGK